MLEEDPRLLSSELDSQTLLLRAASRSRVGVVRLLLEKGAEVNTAHAGGITALHHAASRGHEDVVSFLLTSGADATRVSRSGWTALMQASYSGHVGVVRLLLRSMGRGGVDVTDDRGWTALWLACFSGHADVVRALLLAGATHTIPSIDGRTPRQTAHMSNHPPCVALIEVRGPRSLMPLLIRHGQHSVLLAHLPTRCEPILCRGLCCSGGRASCSVPMSSTRPGRYTKTPPHTSKPLQPQCPPI
jgi:ankyrin repeat protein